MCLGIPLRIIEVNGVNAVGEMSGIRRNVRIDFIPDIKPGEYVMIHAGFALERIKTELAHETMDAISEIRNLQY